MIKFRVSSRDQEAFCLSVFFEPGRQLLHVVDAGAKIEVKVIKIVRFVDPLQTRQWMEQVNPFCQERVERGFGAGWNDGKMSKYIAEDDSTRAGNGGQFSVLDCILDIF